MTWLLVLALVHSPATAARPTPDQGLEVLDRAIAAHGGLPAFQRIRDWRVLADRSLSEPPYREIYEEYYLNDGRIRTLLIKRRSESVLVFGHDGERGFALVDGRPRGDAAARGEAYYRAHGEFYLRGLPFKWRDPGVRVSLAGEESLRGRPVYWLRITAEPAVGVAWKDVWRAAIDRETLLLVEARLTHDLSMQSWMETDGPRISEIAYRFGDHRPVGDLVLPFLMEYWRGEEKTGENRIRSFELDVGIEPGFFTPGAHR